ncbi:MAG: hypothetical protein ACKO0Z_05210 [Betaproteobacteria bacterium]
MSRATNIHAARVYLAQSRHFTNRARGFSFVLLEWAARARRRAGQQQTVPAQQELFA